LAQALFTKTSHNRKEKMMKRILVLTLSLMLVGVSAQAIETGGQNSSSAVAMVQMKVAPNIAVSSITPNMNIGSVQSGGFNFPLVWNVQANIEKVFLMLEASNLYKGGDATIIDPLRIIPLDSGTPASVVPDNANAVMLGSMPHGNVLAWTGGAGASIPGNPIPLPTVKSETWPFEASGAGDFSQNVTTTIYYQGPTLQQVQGIYSGGVRFTAFIFPPQL
jgi:hypothetical protein